MKKGVLAFSLLAFCSFQEVSVTSITNMHVIKAAEGQLGAYTSRIPSGDANKYGFKQEDDMELLTVDKPYRIMEFNPDFFRQPLEEDRNYLAIRNEWKVPVAAKGVYRVMLTVNGVSSNYKVVGMGDSSLARELQPASRGISDSDEYYLLRVPILGADFFVHEADKSFADAEFIPLRSASNAIKAIHAKPGVTYSLTEVETIIKDELERRAKQEPVSKSAKSADTKTGAPAKKAVKKPVVKKTPPIVK